MAIVATTWNVFGDETGRVSDPTAAQVATVTADVATLVADGATPTQAHVNTLNTDYAVILAALSTGYGMKIMIDTSIFTKRDQIMAVLTNFIKRLSSSSTFT